ncbi:MAG TPA: VCBS repeat-containing protein, partial [Puia sp.]
QDVYIAGTKVRPGQIYLQSPDGVLHKKDQPAFKPFNDFEDGAVTFFDANGDGHADLFIGPAGNNAQPFSRQMQNRLFLGDGHGNFTLDANAFPTVTNGANTSVVLAYDFNHDGHTDLFLGGRSVPREYGSTPASFIFMNDGKGHFTDIAAAKNPDIAGIGMVTSAVMADITGDSTKELVITGEWMAPHIFSFNKDHFEEIKTDLSNLFGWWESVAAADVNGDGRQDLILGNIGENFYLRPDSAHPVRLWLYDFDHNDNPEKILTRYVDGKDMPVFLKHEMERQLPMVKKKNLKHNEYAQKSIRDLLPAELLDSATVKQWNFCTSIVAINQGNGRFSIQPLPFMTQLSSINAIQCLDIDGDGKQDLVLGGNEFGFLPQFGRLDASKGHVLLGTGNGRFTWLPPSRSGLQLEGQIRDIQIIRGPSGKAAGPTGAGRTELLFLRNDDYPVLFNIHP